MKRILLFVICVFSLIPLAIAQSDSVPSRELQEVEVSVSYPSMSNDLFSSSTSLYAPVEVLQQLSNASLSDFLVKGTPLFLKETGNGMLSTLSLRGTSSAHTKVLWEGVSINSQTMGQVDFSQLPLLFFDDVSVHPGGEGAVYGNGSIGGSVSLSDQLSFKDTFSLQLHSEYGSFSSLHEAAKLRVGNSKVQSSTALFYRQSDNDFKFEFRNEKQRQQNAGFYDYGILEDFNFHITSTNLLALKIWHTYYNRNIQPMMQNNLDVSKYETIENRSSKILFDYVHYAPFLWKIRLGWLADDQTYESHMIATDDWLTQSSVEKTWGTSDKFKIDVKIGGDIHAILPEVYAYMDTSVEWRGSLYALSKFLLTQRCVLTCNLRKDFVSNLKVPFSPSFGMTYQFVQKQKNNLSAAFLCSRNVNVPTLNDRYWGRIDDKDVRTEKGANLELNIKYGWTNETYSLTISSALYRNAVTDWILWMPRGNVWKPVNLDQVLAKGIETSLNQKVKWKSNSLSLDVNYAYNHTEIMKGFSEMAPFEGRQMPLLPCHTLSACLYGTFNTFHYSLMGKYVGERNTTDVFELLDSYFLLNLMADYEFVFKKKENLKIVHSLDVGVQVNNLLGAYYQTMPYRAMPLQNFNCFLKYHFGK